MKTKTNAKIVSRLRFFSRIFAVLVFLVGFCALVGWQFDVVIFKRIVPTLPVIAPNTAFSFFLGGIVLFLASDPRTAEKKYLIAVLRFFSLLIALVGLITLLEYLLGKNFGIDRLLFASAQGEAAVRMSPQSAFNFLMAGVSLLFVVGRKSERVKIGQVAILFAGAVSLVSLAGFVYNISSFYTISPYKGMAAHTAVAFVAFFLGILSACPETGFVRIFTSKSLSGIAARRLFATLIFILAAEICVALGRRANFLSFNLEALLHLLIIAAVFVYLIFFAFRSLDELGKMESSLARSRELEQAKTEFVGLASHQLRTPLTAVAWYAEMLLGKDFGTFNKKQEDYLREIYAGNQRMIDLVDDLLNTSRIDMGTLKVKLEPVNLTGMMEDTLKEFLPQTSQKRLHVERKYSRSLPAVKADPELSKIVFQNLISNAVKYNSPGGKISVEIKKRDSDILVRVADSGWGIPAGQQRKIFTKLFRADNVRKKDTEGTGLGLYVVRAIVKKSGGKIWFESKEGKGTVFYISLKV